MQKEYHLWLNIKDFKNSLFNFDGIDLCCSLSEFKQYENDNIIYTTLPCTLSTDLLIRDYKVFVHDLQGNKIEIKLGKNECTSRVIKLGHNLEKLLLAGEFCDVNIKR